MPSGRALLISLCHCLLHLTVDQVYFGFFLIYFKINKYEHLALKNISFYEIDDFSFLSFFEKKKYRHVLTNCTWETVVWDFCMVKSLTFDVEYIYIYK